jgi:multimeric flavodoxin WrbA
LWRSQALAGKPAGIFVSTGGQGGGQETTAWVLVLLLPPMHIYIQFCHHLPAEVSCTVFFLKSGWPLKQTS